MALEIFDTSNPQSDGGLCEDNRIKLAHKVFLEHHPRIPDLLKYLITSYPMLPVVEVYITYLYKCINKSHSSWHRPSFHSSSSILKSSVERILPMEFPELRPWIQHGLYLCP